ncbi:hypothetical protein [Conexibacter woesei]|uniref:hypothetical protein n=1 Tax=Conexibacter woesei TaxID=191495 RepID=UPI000414CE29|nr:hypothetical protein [Conexibacter woesei]
MAEWVTPDEMALDLGVDGKRLRRWLRRQQHQGDRRLAWHGHRMAWRIEPGLAWDLKREFAVEVLGASFEDVWGPHAWLNWHAQGAGRPKRTSRRTSSSLVLPNWLEFGLYSDAAVRGQLEVGPYKFINTIASEQLGGNGAALRVVLRADDHLAGPDHTSPIDEGDDSAYGAGGLDDELAALLSLALTCRFRSGGITREGWEGGDPAGDPVEHHHRRPYLALARGGSLLPGGPATARLEDAEGLLHQYSAIQPGDAIAAARAARQFADALWFADLDPRVAWIKLVGAIESAAVRWHAAQERDDVALLRRNRKRVYNAIRDCDDDVVCRVAKDLAGTLKATDKFKDFILEFDPGPPEDRPDGTGRLDWSELEGALDRIYEHRSRDLHAGIAFPSPLCEPVPRGGGPPPERFPAIAAEAFGGSWMAEDLPMYFHTFVHIVGGALRRWISTLRSTPTE